MNEEAPSTQTKGKKNITTQVETQNQLVNTDTIFSEVQNETNAFENMHDRTALAADEAKSDNTTVADNKTKWICEYCTYENFPLSLKCTMCRAVKPLLGEDIYRLKEVDAGASAEATALFSYDNHQQVNAWSVEKKVNAESLHERVRPLKISPATSEVQPSVSVPKWPCPACTYENWPKTLKCAMCGTNNNSKTSPLPSHTSLFNSNNGDKESSLHSGLYDNVTGNNKISLKHSNSRLQLGINEICNTPSAQSIHDLDSNSRRLKRQTDWAWLQACLGVVDGDQLAVEQYLAGGGDPARALTAAEVALLNRASAFDTGHTLVHLAIRFQREDILSTLLSQISGGGSGIKRAPSYIAPDLASAIRRHVASTIRYKKGSFQCRFLQEFVTFSLPAEVEELPHAIQEQLFEELLDRDAQQQLESEPPVINWSLELTVRLGSRLYALWNRSAGDCLLDAVMQAQWGVFDRDNTLRRALSESLHNAGRSFYPRWREYECLQASLLSYSLDENQLLADWSRLVAGAGVAGRSLQQMHVFALAHITRRPIIVYGVNVVNSFRGEAIGYARFQGIYLPLLWESEFCSKSPLCLGYTRGHFSALVPVEAYSQSANAEYICREQEDDSQDMTFLPLTDADGKLLPVHFLNMEETGSEESLVRRWLEVCVSGGGLLVAQQRLHKRPLLVAQLLEEWLNHYRQIAQQTRGPFPPRLQAQAPEFSSDGDTDEE